VKQWVGRAGAVLALVAAVGCQTSRPDETIATPPPRTVVPFIPAQYTANIKLADGRYPDLFAPESHALWVAPEVRTLKINAAQDAGDPVEPELMEVAQVMDERYIIIECTTVSAFADMSIAYDVVGFRGVSPYLETASGTRVAPVQVEIGSPVTEEARGALKAFTRTNLLVFPKFATGNSPSLPSGEPVRLVLEGFHSIFYFAWEPEPSADVPPKKISEDEHVIMVKTKFRDLYGKMQRLGRTFD
jgi:hypothetical protein